MTETGSPECVSRSLASSIPQRVTYSRGDVPTVALNLSAKLERAPKPTHDEVARGDLLKLG